MRRSEMASRTSPQLLRTSFQSAGAGPTLPSDPRRSAAHAGRQGNGGASAARVGKGGARQQVGGKAERARARCDRQRPLSAAVAHGRASAPGSWGYAVSTGVDASRHASRRGAARARSATAPRHHELEVDRHDRTWNPRRRRSHLTACARVVDTLQLRRGTRRLPGEAARPAAAIRVTTMRNLPRPSRRWPRSGCSATTSDRSEGGEGPVIGIVETRRSRRRGAAASKPPCAPRDGGQARRDANRASVTLRSEPAAQLEVALRVRRADGRARQGRVMDDASAGGCLSVLARALEPRPRRGAGRVRGIRRGRLWRSDAPSARV